MSIEGAKLAHEEARARTELQKIQVELMRRTADVGREAAKALDRYMEALREGAEDAPELGTEFLRLWTVYVMLRSGDDIRALGNALKELKGVFEVQKSKAPAPKSVNISI